MSVWCTGATLWQSLNRSPCHASPDHLFGRPDTPCLADRTHRALTEAAARRNPSMSSIPTWSPTPSGASLSPAAMPPARGTPTFGRCSPPIRRHNWSPVTGCLSRTLRAAPPWLLFVVSWIRFSPEGNLSEKVSFGSRACVLSFPRRPESNARWSSEPARQVDEA